MKNKKSLLSVLLAAVLLCACVAGMLIFSAGATDGETVYIIREDGAADGSVEDGGKKVFPSMKDATTYASKLEWNSDTSLRLVIDADKVIDNKESNYLVVTKSVRRIERTDSTALPITITKADTRESVEIEFPTGGYQVFNGHYVFLDVTVNFSSIDTDFNSIYNCDYLEFKNVDLIMASENVNDIRSSAHTCSTYLLTEENLQYRLNEQGKVEAHTVFSGNTDVPANISVYGISNCVSGKDYWYELTLGDVTIPADYYDGVVTVKDTAIINSDMIALNQSSLGSGTINILGNATVNGNVYAAKSATLQTYEQAIVKLDGGTVNGIVYGKGSTSGTVSGNIYLDLNGTVTGTSSLSNTPAVIGAVDNETAGTIQIDISGGTYSKVVYGLYGTSGSEKTLKADVTINITGGTFNNYADATTSDQKKPYRCWYYSNSAAYSSVYCSVIGVYNARLDGDLTISVDASESNNTITLVNRIAATASYNGSLDSPLTISGDVKFSVNGGTNNLVTEPDTGSVSNTKIVFSSGLFLANGVGSENLSVTAKNMYLNTDDVIHTTMISTRSGYSFGNIKNDYENCTLAGGQFAGFMILSTRMNNRYANTEIASIENTYKNITFLSAVQGVNSVSINTTNQYNFVVAGNVITTFEGTISNSSLYRDIGMRKALVGGKVISNFKNAEYSSPSSQMQVGTVSGAGAAGYELNLVNSSITCSKLSVSSTTHVKADAKSSIPCTISMGASASLTVGEVNQPNVGNFSTITGTGTVVAYGGTFKGAVSGTTVTIHNGTFSGTVTGSEKITIHNGSFKAISGGELTIYSAEIESTSVTGSKVVFAGGTIVYMARHLTINVDDVTAPTTITRGAVLHTEGDDMVIFPIEDAELVTVLNPATYTPRGYMWKNTMKYEGKCVVEEKIPSAGQMAVLTIGERFGVKVLFSKAIVDHAKEYSGVDSLMYCCELWGTTTEDLIYLPWEELCKNVHLNADGTPYEDQAGNIYYYIELPSFSVENLNGSYNFFTNVFSVKGINVADIADQGMIDYANTPAADLFSAVKEYAAAGAKGTAPASFDLTKWGDYAKTIPTEGYAAPSRTPLEEGQTHPITFTGMTLIMGDTVGIRLKTSFATVEELRTALGSYNVSVNEAAMAEEVDYALVLNADNFACIDLYVNANNYETLLRIKVSTEIGENEVVSLSVTDSVANLANQLILLDNGDGTLDSAKLMATALLIQRVDAYRNYDPTQAA